MIALWWRRAAVFRYDFNTVQLVNFAPLRANELSRTDFVVNAWVLGHESRLICEIQLAGVVSCKSEWLKLGGFLSSGDSAEMVIVDLPVLDDLELLFESNVCGPIDVRAVKPEVQKKWGLLRDALLVVQRMVLIKILGLETFGRERIMKNKSLFYRIEILQNTAIDEHTARRVFEDKLRKLKGSGSASDELAAKLVESYKALHAAHVEMVY